MEDNGYFIRSLFKKQAALNIFALLTSTAGPIVCMVLTGMFYGSEGLALTAICSPLFFAASFFGFIISGGAQIVCSAYIAKDDFDGVNKIYSAAVAITLFADILMVILLLVFKEPFLSFAVGEIAEEAKPRLSVYYNYFVLNAFSTMLIYIPLFFAKIAERPQIGLILTAVMSGASIVFSIILNIYMGIEAIAFGQALGAAAAFGITMVMMKKDFRFVFPKHLFIKQIFTQGSPLGLSRLYILLTTLLMNSLFLKLGGSGALAVFGVISMLHRFDTAFIVGITQTLVPLAGVFFVEQDNTSVKQTMKSAFIYGNALLFIMGVLFIILKNQIGALFGLGEEINSFAGVIPIYAVYAVLLLNVSVLSSYYNAVKKIGLANTITLLQEFAVLGAGAYLLSVPLGINGVWLAFPVSGIITLLVISGVLISLKIKHRELKIPLLLNQRLEKEGRYISFSVEPTPEEASMASVKIGEFCDENGVAPEKAMLISMSIEEILILMINNSRRKTGSIAVRLFLLDDMTVLRIRNTGQKFDVIKYYKDNIADDTEKSLDVIGMKYITESADKIYYRQIFGMNSLVVII